MPWPVEGWVVMVSVTMLLTFKLWELRKELTEQREVQARLWAHLAGGAITKEAAASDPSLHGPRCMCDHVRFDHYPLFDPALSSGPCGFPGCDCDDYRERLG